MSMVNRPENGLIVTSCKTCHIQFHFTDQWLTWQQSVTKIHMSSKHTQRIHCSITWSTKLSIN